MTNNNPVKDFWVKDGTDYIANLGTMKKAVVVRFYYSDMSRRNSFYEFFTESEIHSNFYAISPGSYFPFTDEQYSQKFKTHIEAIEYAENIIKEWIVSIMSIGTKNNNGLEQNNEQKVIG